MIIIEHPLPEMVNYLGNNIYDYNRRYRLNRYCITVDEENGRKIIFNDLTKAFVLLEKEEYEEIVNEQKSSIEFLFHAWFLVPVEINDDDLGDTYRKEWFAKKVCDIQRPNNFTILPTTTCNARCFYCYEDRSIKKVMTNETAQDVAKYIIERHNPNAPVTLRWFGGEPTCNISAIDIICSELKNANVEYFSDMTSNSYLLSGKTVKKAKELWNLLSVQITLDGTEEVYNKAKNYIYKDVNPFAQLMSNISELLSVGVECHIRLNVDKHNAEDILILLDQMQARFGLQRTLSYYVMPLFECAMETPRTEEQRKEVYDIVKKVQLKIEDMGYGSNDLSRILPMSMCMADDWHSILITPEGKIGLCEHHVDDEFIGSIYENSIDFIKLQEWNKKIEKLDICYECPLYTHCVKLKHCTEQGKCYKEERDVAIDRFKRIMDRYYQTAKMTPYYLQQERENMRGGNDVSIVTEVTESTNDFLVVKHAKKMYIACVRYDFAGYPLLTKDGAIAFLNNETSLSKYHITEAGIDVVPIRGIFGGDIFAISIEMMNYPGLRQETEFTWRTINFYNGDMPVEQGRTQIKQW